MKVTTLGIDLAKNIFRVHGCDARGKAVVSKSLTRRQLTLFMANLPPCLVGMEACPTSNYWAREIQKFGHQVRLMAPRFVRPYVVKANKNARVAWKLLSSGERYRPLPPRPSQSTDDGAR
jgi:transposase